MGATYHDLYAAIGVHSGLACGAATDLPSAFAAMRQSGGPHDRVILGDGPTVPTIVFHGDRDTTVHPNNGNHILEQSMKTTSIQTKVHRGRLPGGHAFTRTIHTDASGHVIFEHWN
jgi:poly(3-hydroxybutyrate) depolymerase